jgi:hypothetical protein
MSETISLEVELPEEKLIEAFQRLPPKQRIELLKKLWLLAEPELRTVPANTLYALTGLVSLGGDALTDTEAVYDDHGRH